MNKLWPLAKTTPFPSSKTPLSQTFLPSILSTQLLHSTTDGIGKGLSYLTPSSAVAQPAGHFTKTGVPNVSSSIVATIPPCAKPLQRAQFPFSLSVGDFLAASIDRLRFQYYYLLQPTAHAVTERKQYPTLPRAALRFCGSRLAAPPRWWDEAFVEALGCPYRGVGPQGSGEESATIEILVARGSVAYCGKRWVLEKGLAA